MKTENEKLKEINSQQKWESQNLLKSSQNAGASNKEFKKKGN